jgi:hypothetical protein
MFEVDAAVTGSLPTKPTQTGFYALIRENILTESGNLNLFVKLMQYAYSSF